MNFFECELRKLFEDASVIDHPVFVGRVCIGDLGKDLRVRIEFDDPRTVNVYSSLRTTILNRKNGVVDCLDFRLEDILGIKPVPGNENFPNGVTPYIWVNKREIDWFAFTPSQEDYSKLRKVVGDYVDVFRSREERKLDLASVIASAESKSAEHRPRQHDKTKVEDYTI